jgi:hypothetical protein
MSGDEELLQALATAINSSAIMMTWDFRLGATLTLVMLPSTPPEVIVNTYVTIGEVLINDLLRQPTPYTANLGRALLRVRDDLSPDTVSLAEAASAAFPPKAPDAD